MKLDNSKIYNEQYAYEVIEEIYPKRYQELAKNFWITYDHMRHFHSEEDMMALLTKDERDYKWVIQLQHDQEQDEAGVI